MKLFAKSLSILTFILLLCGCDEMVVLFNALDEQQANPIMALLQDNHLSCQKSAGEENTWKLMVKQRDFAKAVELCQQHGLPQQIYHGVGDVFTAQEVKERDHLAGDFSFVIETDGYTSFSENWKRPLIKTLDFSDYRFGYATHGYYPTKGPQPVFLAVGPDIKQGVVIERGDTVDQAPTYAKLLGGEMPWADGKPIDDLLLSQLP